MGQEPWKKSTQESVYRIVYTIHGRTVSGNQVQFRKNRERLPEEVLPDWDLIKTFITRWVTWDHGMNTFCRAHNTLKNVFLSSITGCFARTGSFSTHFVNPLVLFSGVLWSWLLVTNENSMTASLLHKCDVMWFGTWQILLWMFTTSLLCDKVLLVSLTGGFAPAEHWGLGWLLRGLKWLHLVILNFVFSIFHKASPKKCFWLENKWKQNKTRRRRKVRVAQAKRRKCRDGERR